MRGGTKTMRWLLIPTALVIAFASLAGAQEIVLDRSLRAGDLVLFPSVGDEDVYYYAPLSAKLATHESGKPQFSFLRYVDNVRTQETAREGEGGGIVHAVVELGVDSATLDEARAALRREQPSARIAGPVMFRAGRFGLVSSFADEKGALTQQVIGVGTAPILDGGRAAVSLQLTRTGAKLLWESFQTSTPDITFLFEMQMGGYRAPKRATIEADLERVYEHRTFEAGIATAYVEAEIRDAMEDLYREGAIRLTQVGEDEDLDALVEMAYSKLTDLVFEPSEGARAAIQQTASAAQPKSALDRASALLEKRRQEARTQNDRARALNAALAESIRSEAKEAEREAKEAEPREGGGFAAFLRERAELASQMANAVKQPEASEAEAPPAETEEVPLPEFAAVLMYDMKRSRERGVYRVELDKYTPDIVGQRFDQNVGDLRRFMDDESVFRNINLDDPMFRQREIVASLQGVDASAFEDAIAYVTVQTRKQHENGDETFSELVIDRDSFSEQGNRFKFVYGWKGDEDREDWRRYEYRTVWSFHAAEPVESGWTSTINTVIPLRPPFERRRIELDAGVGDTLKDAGVRSVSVLLLDASGAEQLVTLNTSRGELSKAVDLIVPRGASSYEYEIRWAIRGNESLTSGRRKTESGILYVDELPDGAAAS